MGAVLSDIFVDPDSLPGGKCFSPSCPDFYTVDPDTGLNTTQCRFPTGNVTSWEWWATGGNEEFPGLYPDCDEQKIYGFIQVLFLGGIYGMILSWASDLISNGSEMLLLVPAYRGIVGSVVLPVLGAVPDGAIILFSGLGSDAKEQIVVGVGALAGSTIMLITVPWFIAVVAGKVPVARASDGTTKTVYNPRLREAVVKHNTRHHSSSIFSNVVNYGVKTNRDTRVSGKIMLATSLLYLIIQVPAFFAFGRLEHGKLDASGADVVKLEHPWFVVGFIFCFIAFLAYLAWCVKTSNDNENTNSKVDALVATAIDQGRLTLSGAFFNDFDFHARRASTADDEESRLLRRSMTYQEERAQRRIEQFLHRKFMRYDTDRSGTIDSSELHALFTDLGEKTSDFGAFQMEMDKDKDGTITFDEFKTHMMEYIQKKVTESKASAALAAAASINAEQADEASIDDILVMADGDNEEDNEEVENETGLDPKTQQWEIKKSAFKMMGIGTIVVLVVSDPAVDVLSSIGARTGIPAFYVAFVLAPLASNASELIAAYNYASKKTPSSIGISLATLEGAGIMNNTFCLGIFFLIIFINNDIAWTFTAETLGILLVEIGVAIIAQRETMTVFSACMVLSLYPLSLIFIALLERYTNLN
eukprot:m.184116 g.184116  ORF g.184116 m.184116 type:complete len:645 (+) comp16035_c0_seq1:69-2003(+)